MAERQLTVALAGKPVPAKSVRERDSVWIVLNAPIVVQRGQTLHITLIW